LLAEAIARVDRMGAPGPRQGTQRLEHVHRGLAHATAHPPTTRVVVGVTSVVGVVAAAAADDASLGLRASFAQTGIANCPGPPGAFK
jgi:hypothetical protein